MVWKFLLFLREDRKEAPALSRKVASQKVTDNKKAKTAVNPTVKPVVKNNKPISKPKTRNQPVIVPRIVVKKAAPRTTTRVVKVVTFKDFDELNARFEKLKGEA
jgi:hypothetical protein